MVSWIRLLMYKNKGTIRLGTRKNIDAIPKLPKSTTLALFSAINRFIYNALVCSCGSSTQIFTQNGSTQGKYKSLGFALNWNI